LFCKGADSTIFTLLDNQDAYKNKRKYIQFLNGFGRNGLRTLLITEREFSDEIYEPWVVFQHKQQKN
jgi:hypothetical protein